MSLANLYLKLDNQPAAEAAFRQALQIDPTHAVAHYWLGRCCKSRNA